MMASVLACFIVSLLFIWLSNGALWSWMFAWFLGFVFGELIAQWWTER